MLNLVIATFLATPATPPPGPVERELTRLRSHLAVPGNTPIALAPPTPDLTMATLTRVFIAAGLDVETRANFVRWIDEWNRKESPKGGRLVLVPELASAELVLARYLDRDKIRETTEIVTTPFGTAQGSTGSARTGRTRLTFRRAPEFSYVLRARSDGGLEILWRNVGDLASVEETKSSGRPLWDAFVKLLKARRWPY